jgi:hypothetical protein
MKIAGNQMGIFFEVLNGKKMFGCVMAVTMISRPPSSQSADDDEPDDYWSWPDETGEVGQECTGPWGGPPVVFLVCVSVCVFGLWLTGFATKPANQRTHASFLLFIRAHFHLAVHPHPRHCLSFCAPTSKVTLSFPTKNIWNFQ